MRRFLLGLIIALAVWLTVPGLTPAQYRGRADESRSEAAARDRAERNGIYVVMTIAALIGVAVLTQFIRELRESLPAAPAPTPIDDVDEDDDWDDD